MRRLLNSIINMKRNLFNSIFNLKRSIKIIVILIVAILVLSSVYVVFYLNNDNNNVSKDTIPPTIDSITRNTSGSPGKITSISVSFSDNIGVTEALIFYKSMNDDMWTAESIITGSYNIEIPSNSDDNWCYYATVNDAAGNGPVGDPSTDGSKYYIITVTETVGDLVHTVFIEEASGEDCTYCPGVSELIHELYNSGDYNFEFVSMVVEYDKANKRLTEDYNNVAQPTLYIDGGFEVIMGGAETKEGLDASKYKEAIRTAEQRNVPELKITVKVDYENNSNKFNTNVKIKNFGDETYTGSLKVYLAEIISRFKIKKKTQVYNGFLDFIINEEISVDAGEELQKSKEWDLSGLDPENLVVIAVVFNSESEKRYSVPNGNTEEDKYPFDAYFADAANKTMVIAGGNLPPKVGIVNPVKNMLHLFGKPIMKSPLVYFGFNVTRLIGKTNIIVNASDEDGTIEKVEFYIDNKLIFTDYEAPYEYTLNKIGLFKSLLFWKHTIKVIAYDDTGKTSFVELEIRARL